MTLGSPFQRFKNAALVIFALPLHKMEHRDCIKTNNKTGKLYMPEEEIKDGFSLLQNSLRPKETSCLTSITFEFFHWLTSWLRAFLILSGM